MDVCTHPTGLSPQPTNTHQTQDGPNDNTFSVTNEWHLSLTHTHTHCPSVRVALPLKMPAFSSLAGGTGKPDQAISTQSDGKTFEQLRQECLKKKKLFEDPDFPACDASLYYSQSVPLNFEWKRPGELCKDPQFIVDGADRTDICQGALGDCWLLAAIASLTLHKETFARVVPLDQGFDHSYAGIFHFQFWQHNRWLDVVVDDRLPTVRNRLVLVHSASSNEFWSALLEKAYAKLNGSYESLKGGSTLEAMEDFTGGVGETYETKSAPADLFNILKKAHDRGSMMGCSIDITSSAESEAQTTTGLVKGHAYSITGIEEVKYRGGTVRLIRIRNPWGQVEWNGPWSDNAKEWGIIDSSEKKRILLNSMDDGEFWMEFEDFKANYDKVEICNLTPDALTDDTKHKWEVNVFEGNWIRGSTAGGCRNFIDTFWTNPQFKLTLKETDDHRDHCSVIIALMQKNRRALRKEGFDLETIGFAIYEAPDDVDHLGKDFFRYNGSKARSKTYINVREISERFNLPPGNYLLVPTTFQAHQEADFLIRVFSEKEAEKRCLKSEKILNLHTRSVELYYKDLLIIKYEYFLLSFSFPSGKEIKFDGVSLNTCHSIINLMDADNSGQLEFQEFKVFWEKMKKWIVLFLSFDTDRSGKMSTYELRLALKAAGERLQHAA
uniref:Calpain 9 n=1 Tax=Esox lucius TaxID=8010 RepID=A0AAY5L3E5_ESOLU